MIFSILAPGGTTSLLIHGINSVFVLELELLGRLVAVQALAIEGETEAAGCLASALAVGIKNLAEGGAGLDLEVDLIIVLLKN